MYRATFKRESVWYTEGTLQVICETSAVDTAADIRYDPEQILLSQFP